MQNQGAFYFCRTHSVSSHIQHIIDAAGDPIIAVSVAFCPIAGEIFVWVKAKISFNKALVIAVNRSCLPRPRSGDGKNPLGLPFLLLTQRIEDSRNYAEKGQRGRSRLKWGRAGQRCNQYAPGFGLPPSIDYRTACIPNDLVIPFPGFRVDGFADRAEYAQTLTAGALHQVVPHAHQHADGSRCGVKNIDLMLVDDFPESVGCWVGRNALEHQADGTIA